MDKKPVLYFAVFEIREEGAIILGKFKTEEEANRCMAERAKESKAFDSAFMSLPILYDPDIQNAKEWIL